MEIHVHGCTPEQFCDIINVPSSALSLLVPNLQRTVHTEPDIAIKPIGCMVAVFFSINVGLYGGVDYHRLLKQNIDAVNRAIDEKTQHVFIVANNIIYDYGENTELPVTWQEMVDYLNNRQSKAIAQTLLPLTHDLLQETA